MIICVSTYNSAQRHKSCNILSRLEFLFHIVCSTYKKRLKSEVRSKRAAGEDFLSAPETESIKSLQGSDKKKQQVRLRKHFHERE
jgi:hypothetical protein